MFYDSSSGKNCSGTNYEYIVPLCPYCYNCDVDFRPLQLMYLTTYLQLKGTTLVQNRNVAYFHLHEVLHVLRPPRIFGIQIRIFLMTCESFPGLIDIIVVLSVKVMKMVVVELNFYEATRILHVRKRNQN